MVNAINSPFGAGGEKLNQSDELTVEEYSEWAQEERDNTKTMLKTVLEFVTKIIKNMASLIFSHRYHLDDILYILRPFVYVFCVMKYGRKSYIPVKIAAIMDGVSIFISISRLLIAMRSS